MILTFLYKILHILENIFFTYYGHGDNLTKVLPNDYKTKKIARYARDEKFSKNLILIP